MTNAFNAIKKINIITPYRKGGAYYQGELLTQKLNTIAIYQARHIHNFFELPLSPIIQRADIIQSIIPITYRLWKKPLILHIHGIFYEEKNPWSLMYPKAIKMASKIIVPSLFLQNKLNINNATVIPNVLKIEDFPVIHLKNKATINILTVTGFYFQNKAKGVLNILKNLNYLPEPLKNRINYKIIGGGKFLANIKNKAANFSSIKYEFLGWQNPKDYFPGTDIFLYYSNLDNMPMVILEAMASGLPIITNLFGAIEEMIKNGEDGLIAKNDEEYNDNIIKLITNFDLRKNIGANARQKIEAKFNLDQIIKHYLKIYDEYI